MTPTQREHWSRPAPPSTSAPPWQLTLLMGFLMLSLAVLRYLPGMQFTVEFWSVMMALALPVLLLRRLGRDSLPLTPTEWLILALLATIPPLGAWRAAQVFGQPPLLGLITQRGMFMMVAAFVVYEALCRGRFTMAALDRAFRALAWTNLLLCSPILIFLDPNDFSDMPNFVTDGGGFDNKFILPWTFIVFGFFLYATEGLLTRRLTPTLLSLPFFAYFAVGVGNRTFIALAVFTYVVCLLRWVPWSELAPKLTKAVGVAVVMLLVVQLVAPERLAELAAKYGDAVAVVIGGQEGDDPSANARLYQALVALPYVEENLLFGTGVISNQWGDGYKELFGYFHPSDIGLLGAVFVFGVAGTALFLVQWLLLWRTLAFVRRPRAEVPVLHYAIAAYLIYLAVSSITTGAMVFAVENAVFFLAIQEFGLRRHGTERQRAAGAPAVQTSVDARVPR